MTLIRRARWATSYAAQAFGPWRGSPLEMVRAFPAWVRSRENGVSGLEAAKPWLTYAALRHLEEIVCKEMRVFEYGAGGSTLFLASRAAEVVSIEHDAAWCRRVAEALAARGLGNATVRLVEPQRLSSGAALDPSDPDHYASAAQEHAGASFEAYARAIDAFPDGHFGLVLVDGRARTACLPHAARKVAPGGFLVLDDSEREYYMARTRAALQGLQVRHFPGPRPYVGHFGRTTVWRRPRPEEAA